MIGVQVLGGAIITCGEHRFSDSGARRFAVALYLAAERGRRLDRGATQELLFGDLPEASAAHTFRQYLYKLGTYGWPIRADRSELFLPADAVRSDFDAVIEADRLTPEQLTAIQAGVLPGAFSPELPRFNEWVDEYRARIERELQRALVRHLGSAREVGDWTLAERTARACLALDPLNEEATLGLAESLAISGSKAAAMKVLDEYMREVGVSGGDLKIPANVLRRRIAERLPDVTYRSRVELPFVGRRDEMRLLADRLRKARAGDGQCVLVHGEPGIGKTRLATEFANVAVLEGARVARVASQPHDVHRPLAAFVDLVPLLLELPGALGCSPESMEALRRLTGRETAADTRDSAEVDPETRYHRTTTAIRDLIDAVTAECLLAVVIEDAHWLDPLSLQFIGVLIAQRADRRLLLVVTSRERDAVIQHARHADRMTIVHLEALTAEATSELASVALASDGGDRTPELLQRIQATAGGNPLFVVSLAEHWRDVKARYSVPSSVSTLIQYQLERLSTQALTVLYTVILLGRHCTPQRVAECLQVNALQLAEAFQESETRGLLSRDAAQLACRHWLISDAALRAAPQTTIKWLHTCVADYLQRAPTADNKRAVLWDAAEHWVHAGEDEKAYSVLLECAAAAAAIGRSREACDILARAAELAITKDEKVRAIELALTHAAAGGETPRGHTLFQRLRELGGTVPRGLAMFELAAAMHTQNGIDTIPARIHELLRSNYSDEMAADAALRLLKIADYFGDRTLAEHAKDIRASIRSIAQEIDLEFDLIYETCFGDIDEAVLAARQLLGLIQDWDTGRRITLAYNIAQVFLMAGETANAVRLHSDIYESGIAVGLRRLPLGSALALASIFRNIEATDRCEIWALRAAALADDDLSLRNPEFLFCEVEHILWRGDAQTALDRAVDLERVALDGGNKFTARLASAVVVAALHLQGKHGGRRFETLRDSIDELRGLGRDDFLMQVVCEELVLTNSHAEASRLLARYLHQSRRTRTPLSFGLRALIVRHPELGITVPEPTDVPAAADV